MKEEKISSYQIVMLIAGFFLGTEIVENPAAQSGADAWFTLLVAIAAGFIIVCITAALAMLHQGKSLIEILICCFGKTAGKIIGFLYFLYATWLSGVVVLSFSNYSNSISYPETPIVFITICYMIVIALIVRISLESVGRIVEVLMVLGIVVTLFTFISLFTNFHPIAFLPMFKEGITRLAVNGLMDGLLPFAEVFILLNIMPNLNDKKKTFRSLSLAVFVAGGLMLLSTVRNISVLGVYLTARNVFPSEKVFRLIPSIDMLPLLDFLVITFGIIKVSLVLYVQAKMLGDIFELKEFKIYVLPLAALDAVLSTTYFHDFPTQLYFAKNITPIMYIPLLVLVPVIMLVISLVKRERPDEPPLKLE